MIIIVIMPISAIFSYCGKARVVYGKAPRKGRNRMDNRRGRQDEDIAASKANLMYLEGKYLDDDTLSIWTGYLLDFLKL